MRPSSLVDAVDEARFGGKAAKLARALREGLPVPHGLALDTALVDAIFDAQPEAMVQSQLEFARLAGPCAVRSSAIGEDSEGASFAGQHLTLLGARGADQIAAAVLRVRESAYNESARAYRRAIGMDDRPAVAVVVQQMVEPDVAGVMFTENPLNGADGRIIEASWGLGESVVSGLVVPDHIALDASGRVVERRIGVKDIAVRGRGDGGTFEEAVDETRAAAACLTDATLAELHLLACRCEAVFGPALDIEWAFSGGTLYLLQCRAITRRR